MVVAVESQEPITAIVPARARSAGRAGGSSEEPTLEVKQKTHSRHEKRTKRDYYRHSGDDKQPPIEYVYTYSEETPKEQPDPQENTTTDLVPVNGNGPGKIECTVGEDGNLVVKIRGKPDKVGWVLDPENLPIKLPEGWQLKEIQTNQRSRKIERSRKTRIKDERTLNGEGEEQAVVVYNEYTVAANGSSSANHEEEPQYGMADDEEYGQGERDGVAYVQKKSRKFEHGPAGSTSKIEEKKSEEGIIIDHPDNKQRYSRNLTSLLEKTESASRKFSKQSVTDEKVTETHKSNVMYFDGDSSAPVFSENLHDDSLHSSTNYYRDSRGQRDVQQNESFVIESPDSTPYNSLDRRDLRRRYNEEDVEITAVDDHELYNGNDDHDSYSNVNRTDTVNHVISRNERDRINRDFQNDRNHTEETIEKVNIEERYRYGNDQNGDLLTQRNGNRNLVENTEKTNIEEIYRYNLPVDRNDYQSNETVRESSYSNLSRGDRVLQNGHQLTNGHSEPRATRDHHIVENIEKTNIERYRVHPAAAERPSRSADDADGLQRSERTREVSERHVTSERREDSTLPTQPLPIVDYHQQPVSQSTEFTETRDSSQFYNTRQPEVFEKSGKNYSKSETSLQRHTESSRNVVDSPTMVGAEIRVDASGTKSPSPPQDRQKNTKDGRVTIDDRYRVIGRSEERPATITGVTQHSLATTSADQQTKESKYARNNVKIQESFQRQTQGSNFTQHAEDSQNYRSHSRQTDSSSTGERIIPIGVSDAGPRADSRESSRKSSVDLSDIKPGEHLDNRILKDRGNLAQGGSMGHRRPPSRNPIKYHFGEENGPDDVMSSSDVTLPTHLTTAFRASSIPNGNSVASYDTDFYAGGAANYNNKTRMSSVKVQQTSRDERVLINCIDTSAKPDWVRNIDDHFTGTKTQNIHYDRENVTSPTPRIEEIVTVPNGSTVITVNGETEPVHGIVTEPPDRPLTTTGGPIDHDVVHQSEKGTKYGFTRTTESKGHRQVAKENVQYQERRENTKQISVSYKMPGRGTETREYTWDGVHEQPEEKVTFHESRERTKDVSVTFGLDGRLPPPPVHHTTMTETKETQEKIIFDETREPPRKQVSVKMALETQQQQQLIQREPIPLHEPIQSDTFFFEEERKREREVNFVIGLDQQRAQSVRQLDQSNERTVHNKEEMHETRQKEVYEIQYREPPPVQKVTFHEDREITRDVSFTLGLETERPVAPLEPLPIEKITFEETRVVPADRDVAIMFGLDEPVPEIRSPSPGPVSIFSDATIITPVIVPQYSRNEEKTVEKFQKIVEERYQPPPPPRSVQHEDIRTVEKFQKIVEGRYQPPPPPPQVHHEDIRTVEKFQQKIVEERYQPPSPPRSVYHEDIQTVEKFHKVVEQRYDPPPPTRIVHQEDVRTVDKFQKIVQERYQPQPPPQVMHQEDVRTVEKFQKIAEERYQPPPPPCVVNQEDVRTVDKFHKIVQERYHPQPPPQVMHQEDVRTVEKFQKVVEERYQPPQRPPRVMHQEDVRTVDTFQKIVEERYQPLPPPRPMYHEDVRTVERFEKIVEEQHEPSPPPRIQAQPPAILAAKADIIPPLPRKVSFTVAAEASAVHHNEVELTPAEAPHVFETSVDHQTRERTERSESRLQVDQPEPSPLPPTSGRVEKHLNLESIIPEPTGQPLPHSMGTYGYTYQATLRPKTPEHDKVIDFHIHEAATTTNVREDAALLWYVKEGEVQSVISDEVSSIGEPRAVTPPYHPELTATADIIPPTRLEALVHTVAPPVLQKPKMKKVQPLLSAQTEISPPPKQFYYGEEEEDRLSMSEAGYEEVKQPPTRRPGIEYQKDVLTKARADEIRQGTTKEVILPKPPLPEPKKPQVSELSRTPAVEADSTHHTEVNFQTPEEEELWKSSLERHALPRPNRTEQNLQLQQIRRPPPSLPTPSGRIPKKTGGEKLEPEVTGRPQPKAMGTYGYLYIAHVDARPPTTGKTVELQYQDVTTIDLDVQQVLLAAFTEVQPPLTPNQQHQLLEACVDIFPPLTETQQEQLLYALVEITPPLTREQTHQLLTGTDEITPPLTYRQQQQLSTASAEIIPSLTETQQRQLLYVSTQIEPPVTPKQQRQLLEAIAEIFPPPSNSYDTVVEEYEEDSSRQISRQETTSRTSQLLNLDIVLVTVISQMDMVVSKAQRQQLLSAYLEVFPPFTEPQQKRWLNALALITPPLTHPQRQQILTGNDRISPVLTQRQTQQLLRASTEIFTSLSVDQLNEVLEVSFAVEPPLSPAQRHQVVDVFSEIFSSSASSHTRKLSNVLEKFSRDEITEQKEECLREERTETTEREERFDQSLVLEIVLRSAFSEIRPYLVPKQQEQIFNACLDIFPPLTEPQKKRWLNALSMATPLLTAPQQRQLLIGDLEVFSSLTSTQQQQIVKASTEVFVTLSTRQIKQVIYSSTQTQPPLSHDQQRQLMNVLVAMFPPKTTKTEALIGKFEDTTNRHSQSREELTTIREQEESAGKINQRGVWEKTSAEKSGKITQTSAFRDISIYDLPEPPRRHVDHEEPEPDWVEETRHIQVGRTSKTELEESKQSKRYVGHGKESNNVSVLATLFFDIATYPERLRERSYQGLAFQQYDPDGFSSDDEELEFSRAHESGSSRQSPVDVLATSPDYLFHFNEYVQGANIDAENLVLWGTVLSEARKRRARRLEEERRRKAERALLSPTSQMGVAYLPSSPIQTRSLIATSPMGQPDETAGYREFSSLYDEPGDRRPDFLMVPVTPYVTRGSYSKDKQVPLSEQRKFLAEQTTHLDDDEQDMEVSAISMNIRPRVKSEMYMAPSPPNRCLSPSMGGFQYAASPPLGSPPHTEYSGFIYEAPVDGHNSPMFAELGTYGFTYQATLDGSEPYKRLTEGNMGEIEMHAESRRRSDIESLPDTSKPMSATPPRRSPWSTPPVTPTPIMATPPSTSRGTTPLSTVKELPEPSKDSPWNKDNVVTPWGRSWIKANIVGDQSFTPIEYTLTTDPANRQEVRGQVYSPEVDVHERITEAVSRSRQEQDATRVSGSVSSRVSALQSGSRVQYSEKLREESTGQSKHNAQLVYGSPLERPEMKSKKIVSENQNQGTSIEQRQQEERFGHQEFSKSRSATSFEKAVKQTFDAKPEDAKSAEDKPEWVRLVEERKKRQEPPQRSFRLDKHAKKEATGLRLEAMPEEDPLEAALERLAEMTPRSSPKQLQKNKNCPDTSPSLLRKWGNVNVQPSVAEARRAREDPGFTKGYRRHTTETKEVIEESRFHSEQAMLEAVEASQSNSNLTSTMSQSMPSLAHVWKTESGSVDRLNRENPAAVSLEELQKSNRHVRRSDGAEEEIHDVSFARRGEAVSPETRRTKRTVVRKLVNGEWKDIAVREENMPLDGDLLLAVDHPAERMLAELKDRDDDEWSLSDAVIEETTTTRTIRRVEEEEEDIISLTGTE